MDINVLQKIARLPGEDRSFGYSEAREKALKAFIESSPDFHPILADLSRGDKFSFGESADSEVFAVLEHFWNGTTLIIRKAPLRGKVPCHGAKGYADSAIDKACTDYFERVKDKLPTELLAKKDLKEPGLSRFCFVLNESECATYSRVLAKIGLPDDCCWTCSVAHHRPNGTKVFSALHPWGVVTSMHTDGPFAVWPCLVVKSDRFIFPEHNNAKV